MKKSASLLLAVFLLFAGCQKEEEKVLLAELIPAEPTEAVLDAEGKTVALPSENINELMEVLKTIEIHEADKKEVKAPGSMALTIKLKCEEEVTVTLPYLYYDGKAYCADETCLEEFGKFFE